MAKALDSPAWTRALARAGGRRLDSRYVCRDSVRPALACLRADAITTAERILARTDHRLPTKSEAARAGGHDRSRSPTLHRRQLMSNNAIQVEGKSIPDAAPAGGVNASRRAPLASAAQASMCAICWCACTAAMRDTSSKRLTFIKICVVPYASRSLTPLMSLWASFTFSFLQTHGSRPALRAAVCSRSPQMNQTLLLRKRYTVVPTRDQ